MKVGDYCKRAVISINAGADVAAAARLMRDEHVGFLVVYADEDELRKPVGVLTDRDLVLAVLARDITPSTITVQDMMSRQPLVAEEQDELCDMLHAMRMAGIRRMPVIDMRGALIGIMAIDDAIDVVTSLMCDIAGSIRSEQRREWRIRVRSGARDAIIDARASHGPL
jgi:predicted transcriptional regulator